MGDAFLTTALETRGADHSLLRSRIADTFRDGAASLSRDNLRGFLTLRSDIPQPPTRLPSVSAQVIPGCALSPYSR
jgi:hypothetical protein